MSSHQLLFFGLQKTIFQFTQVQKGKLFFPLKSDYKSQMHVYVDDFHPWTMVVVEK
jgi:hypothetical protein